MTVLTPFPYGGEQMGGKRRGVPVKTLKKILKKAGLKTTGKKAALTRRAKQAKLVKKGGDVDTVQVAKVKTAEEEAEEARKAAEAAENTATMMKGGRKRKSRSKKYFF
jgi:SAP domain